MIDYKKIGRDIKSGKYDYSICVLTLTARTSNCLRKTGIQTIKDLLLRDMTELYKIKNFGIKCLNELNDELEKTGLNKIRQEKKYKPDNSLLSYRYTL